MTILINDQAVIATVSQLNAAWDNAFNSKDAALLASFYAAAATVSPAGAEQVTGPQNIQAFFGNVIGLGFTDHKIDLIEVVSEGNLAFQRGKWSAASVEASGERKTYGGSLQVTYGKQADGGWKVLAHIWN